MEKEILQILKTMEKDISSIKGEMTSMKSDITSMKSTLNEHTEILRALQHSAEVNKAEHDKMSNDIAHIKGDVETIKKELRQVEMVTANNWSDITKLKSLLV